MSEVKLTDKLIIRDPITPCNRYNENDIFPKKSNIGFEFLTPIIIKIVIKLITASGIPDLKKINDNSIPISTQNSSMVLLLTTNLKTTNPMEK